MGTKNIYRNDVRSAEQWEEIFGTVSDDGTATGDTTSPRAKRGLLDAQEAVLCPRCKRGNHVACLGEPCACERCAGALQIGGAR